MMFCKEHDPQVPHPSWTKCLLLLCANRKTGPETPKGFPGHTADSQQSSEAELTFPDPGFILCLRAQPLSRGSAFPNLPTLSLSHRVHTFSARGEASVCSEDWESREEFTRNLDVGMGRGSCAFQELLEQP